MAYVQVPKDLTKVKTKVMFNLTKRQLICFGLAAVMGVPLYFVTKGVIGNTAAAMLMIVIMMPCFLFAIYEKDGKTLEQVLKNMYEMKFKRPGIRPYKTDNFYAAIQEEIYEKEVLGIGKEYDEKTGKKKKHSGKSGKN